MRAVLFDLFGTLVPNVSRDAFLQATEEIAATLGGETSRVRDAVLAQFPLRMNGEIPDGPRQFERLAGDLGLEADDAALASTATTWPR